MKYVYILRSLNSYRQRYIGITSDIKQRLAHHNEGKSPFTSKFKPWKVETYVAFSDKTKAQAFEKYLKTGSGWAFSLKRL